jgi:ribose transport system ATP-binding protein
MSGADTAATLTDTQRVTCRAVEGSSQPLVEARGLVKWYPGVRALGGVDFEARPGEIIGLVGKNGAGKSSLIKIVAGAEKPDEGDLLIAGEPPPIVYGPHDAHRLGLAFVHQELGNFPELTVAENVAIGTRFPRSGGVLVSRRKLNAHVKRVLDELGAEIPPERLVAGLTAVQQRLVMIARALYHDARVLFLDEPSVSLTIAEIAHLHRIVRSLRDQGRSIVYVSHRLHEIASLTDRVVVMQDGLVILEHATEDIDEQVLMDAIAGPAPTAPANGRREQTTAEAPPILSVNGIGRPPAVSDVSLELRPGEILGIAGLVGSGRTELVRLICGADRPAYGTIEIDGKPVRVRNPVDAIRHGIALLPEDRRHEGLVATFSVRENITLPALAWHRLARLLPFPNRGSERKVAQTMVSRLDIATPDVEREVRRLSGGSQQKVVLAKWLHRSGRLLLFDEPTQGVDVGAKAEIFSLMRDLAAEGKGIILICSDFAELALVCTRVVAIQEGSVSGELRGPEITEDAMIRLAYRRVRRDDPNEPTTTGEPLRDG